MPVWLVLRYDPHAPAGHVADQAFAGEQIEGPHDCADGDPVLLGEGLRAGQGRTRRVSAGGDPLPQQVCELLVCRPPGQRVDHDPTVRRTW